MATSFGIQAVLQVKGPPNLKQLVTQIKTGLSGIKANINLKMAPSTNSSIAALNSRLNYLNKNLQQVQKSGIKANAVMQQLATTFNSMGTSAAAISSALKGVSTVVNQANKGLGSATKNVGHFSEAVGVYAKRFSAFSLAVGTITSFTYAVQDGFKEAIRFQHELVRLKQVGGDSASAIKSISDEITRLSTGLGVSSKGLAETSVTLRQAGLNATQTKDALEALAKTELAPNFDDIKKTTEGVIAIMSQFKVQGKQVEQSLGSINEVAAKYAVESSDLIEAVRRGGGAFKAAGGNLNEFLALFTSVRATTRESAETISTGFRTIFARLQRPETINSLKQLGIVLEDIPGQFVGPYEAVKRLSAAFKDIPTSDRRFSELVEEIGGIRQISKVIPLIKEFTTAEQALGVAMAGQDSLTKDAIIAQGSLIVRTQKLKEEFLDLFRVIADNPAFKAFAVTALELASALIQITKALSPLIPLLTVLGTIKIGRGVAGLVSGVSSGFSRMIRFAGGGSVPGSGSGDTVPAMLTPGEFVINKASAQKIGLTALNKLNGGSGRDSGGKSIGGIQHFQKGGPVPKNIIPDDLLEEFNKLGISLHKIDLSKFVKSFKYVENFSHFSDKFPDGTNNIKGLFNTKDKSIELRKDLPLSQKLSTLLHEITHAFDSQLGPRAGKSPFSSHVEGSVFNKAAKLAHATQPENLLANYEKRLPGVNLDHERLAFGVSDFVSRKVHQSKYGGMKLRGPFDIDTDNGDINDHAAKAQAFDDFFENKILKNIQKVHPFQERGGPINAPATLAISAASDPNKSTKVDPRSLPIVSNSVIDSELRRQGHAGKFQSELDEMYEDARRKKIMDTPTIDIADVSEIKKARKFKYQAMDHTGKEFKGVVDAFDKDHADRLIKENNLFPTSIKEKRSFFDRFKFNRPHGGPPNNPPGPPNGPNSSNGPNDPSRFSRAGKFVKSKFGGIAALATPFLAEQALGTARDPGFLGQSGAKFGSVAGNAVAGAGIGFQVGGPVGALIGGLGGAALALVNFKKEVEDIKFEKASDNFVKSISGGANKAGIAAATKTIEEQIKESDQSKASVFGSGGFKSLGIAFGAIHHGSFAKAAEEDRAQQNAETSEKFKPLLQPVLEEFRRLAEANPGKTMAELEQMNKELARSKFVLGRFDTEAVKATTTLINTQAKQIKTQQTVDNSLAKLGFTADQLSQKISLAGEMLEKNLDRNAVGRGGRISGGTDFFNIGSLGGQGKELQEFTKSGGVLDKSRLVIQKALDDASGKGPLESTSVENTILESLKKQGVTGDNATGKLIIESVQNALAGPSGEELLKGVSQGNVGDALSKILSNPDKLKGETAKANTDFIKAQQLLAQNAVRLAEEMDNIRAEQEKVDQFRIGARREQAQTLMANNDFNFFDGRGGVMTPEDQMAEINSRFARESFTRSQGRFGIGEGEATNPQAILSRLNSELSNLKGLQNQSLESTKNGGNPADFSRQIADSTMKIRNYQEALKNLSTSTTLLETAQNKLQLAMDKEAADLAGRKSVGEERAFGSRQDIRKGFMSDQLIGAAVQQGHLNNFSDEQRQMVLQRLQQTSGVERDFGGQRLTGQQIIDSISAQFMPESNIPSTAVNTPNGRRNVSNDVLNAQANVSAIQERMAAAGEALNKFNEQDIVKQTGEQINEFGNLIKNINAPLKDLLETVSGGKNGNGGKKGVAGFANGGVARGTDTVPAMLTPGEFIVSASNARKNKGVLNQINNGAVYMAGGGFAGFDPTAINQLLLKQQAQRERAREIEKRVARRERLGLPEYVPVSKRVDNSPANAFNDPEGTRLRGEQITRESNIARRNRAAQRIANEGGRGFRQQLTQRLTQGQAQLQQANQAQQNKQGQAFNNFENARPLIDALNSFPRELTIKRDGNINVVINGAEVISKIKGDLENEVWAKIIETIQREVPKAVKNMPG